MLRNLILVVLGGMLGFAAGWFAAPRQAPSPTPPVAPARHAQRAVHTPHPSRERAWRGRAAPTQSERRAEPARAADGGSLSSQAMVLALENAALRSQLVAARKKLAEQSQDLKADEGQAISKPKDLAQRFQSKSLLHNVNTALEQAGFQGAQVTAMDCTEYPCIVYGEGMGSRADFRKLNQADAFAAYAHDEHSDWGWGYGKDANGKPTYHFGVAVWPKGDPSAAHGALRKRLSYRTQQMEATFRH